MYKTKTNSRITKCRAADAARLAAVAAAAVNDNDYDDDDDDDNNDDDGAHFDDGDANLQVMEEFGVEDGFFAANNDESPPPQQPQQPQQPLQPPLQRDLASLAARLASGAATHNAPAPLPFSVDNAVVLSAIGKGRRPASAQLEYCSDEFNRDTAVLLARLALKREDIEAILKHFGTRIGGLMPSHYHFSLVLKHTFELVPPTTFAVGDAVVDGRNPLQLVAAMVRELQDKASEHDVDFKALFDYQQIDDGVLPSSILESPLYRDALAFVNTAALTAVLGDVDVLPVLIDMYIDEYRINSRGEQACALRVGLTIARAHGPDLRINMREVCTFNLQQVDENSILTVVVLPLVQALEHSVLLPATSDHPALFIRGSLCRVFADMKERWKLLGMKGFSGVLAAQPRHEWWAAAKAGSVTVRNLPLVVRKARQARDEFVRDDGNRGRANAVFDLLNMHDLDANQTELPALFRPGFDLLMSSIFHFPPCIMHQWSTGHVADVLDDVGLMLGWPLAQIVNERLAQVVVKTLNVAKQLYRYATPLKRKKGRPQSGAIVKAITLTSEQASDTLKVLPELLHGLGRSADKCTKLVMALIRYIEHASLPSHQQNLRADEWSERTQELWQHYLKLWSTALHRSKQAQPSKRRRAALANENYNADADADQDADEDSDGEYVDVEYAEDAAAAAAAVAAAADADADGINMPPKLIDESLTAQYVVYAGPIGDASTRPYEADHKLGKFVAHLRSRRRDNVGKSVALRRSVFEHVGGPQEARAPRRRPVDPNKVKPFESDAVVLNPVHRWLEEGGVSAAREATGIRLGTNNIYFGEMLHVTFVDGYARGREAWGVFENVVIVDKQQAPTKSEWVLMLSEFDAVEHAPTGSLRATPCQAEHGETIAIWSADVQRLECRYVIKVPQTEEHDNAVVWLISKRAPALVAVLKA